VAQSMDEYVATAVRLAHDPGERADVQARLLAAQRGVLFDAAAYAARFCEAVMAVANTRG